MEKGIAATPQPEGRPDGRQQPPRRRGIWLGVGVALAGVVVGGLAVMFGLRTGFSQPLATFLAGIGALTAGILAYLNGERTRALTEEHHQRDSVRERERHRDDSRQAKESALRERYTAIATQLADPSTAIRQAGVYALTALADDWHAFGEDDERQVCINLLQWYLRVPLPAVEDLDELDRSELEIRRTIVGILTERRRRPRTDPKSWASTTMSLREASLPCCNFRVIDFSELDMSGADLRRADLARANMSGANLSHARLSGATLVVAKLCRTNLTSATLYNANLAGADLTSANLYLANLGSASLRKANLTTAALVGANLLDADISGANLTGAQTITARLKGAVHDASTVWPEGFTPPGPLPEI